MRSGLRAAASTPSAIDPLDRQLVLLLLRAEQELSGAMQRTLAPHGLTRPQAGALQQLRTRGPLPMRALAAGLSCDASNVTGIVDRLTERGLVGREVQSTDRRVKHVVLTEAGAQLADEMWLAAARSTLLMNLPADVKADLHQALLGAFAQTLSADEGPSVALG